MNCSFRVGSFALRFLFGLMTLMLGASAQTVNPNAVALFKSGFENNVVVNPPVSGDSFQYITGSDQSTGFTWPISAFNPQVSALQNILLNNQSQYVNDGIETVTGPNGSSTKALRLNITSAPSPCCLQSSLQTSGMSDIRDVYARYWIKLGPEFLQQTRANTTNFWRMMWEMKTSTDFRITPMVYADSSGTPYWYIKADNNPAGCSNCVTYWEIQNHTVPVPTGRWFLMEFYLHRSTGSDGRVFWAADGQVIADKFGPNYGAGNEQIYVLMYKNLYGNYFPQEEWIDDLEIWSLPPCTNLPCGAPGGPNPGDTQPPTVPTKLTATALSSSQISLSWTASTDNVGVAGYRIYRNGGTTPFATVTATTYQDNGLASSTTYTYTVAAYDAAGNASAQSSSAAATTQFAPPNLLTGMLPTSSTTLESPSFITDGDLTDANYAGGGSGPQWIQFDLGGTYSLTGAKLWHYCGDNRTYHGVIVQLANVADFSSGVITVFNNDFGNTSGQGAGTDAEYQEFDAGKDIPFNPVNARYVRFWVNGSNVNVWNHYMEAAVYGNASAGDIKPPSIPGSLTAGAVSSSQINLSWSASTDNVGVAGYNIYRNGSTNPIASVTGTTYQNNGLASSTTYTYTVAAYDAAGNVSAKSNSASATTSPSSKRHGNH